MTNIFTTLAKPVVFTYEEKRSRFIAHIWPVTSKNQGFEYFEQIKQDLPDARHHCWAYIIGNPEHALSAGFNDDGEPSGTAGKPMLNVLSQRKIGNVFAVVVRYFGGIKLGAGGLTRAYGQAISRALDSAECIGVIPMSKVSITADYALENDLRNTLKQYPAHDISVDYGNKMTLHCQFPSEQITNLKSAIQEQSNGQAHCIIHENESD